MGEVRGGRKPPESLQEAAGRMDVAEGKESQRPAELELTFQRVGVRLAAEKTSGLATRKELEAEGSPIMDDRANDGRGARMASEGAGHGSEV